MIICRQITCLCVPQEPRVGPAPAETLDEVSAKIRHQHPLSMLRFVEQVSQSHWYEHIYNIRKMLILLLSKARTNATLMFRHHSLSGILRVRTGRLLEVVQSYTCLNFGQNQFLVALVHDNFLIKGLCTVMVMQYSTIVLRLSLPIAARRLAARLQIPPATSAANDQSRR